MVRTFAFLVLRTTLGLGLIAMAISAPTQASMVYDFKMSGGANNSLSWAGELLFVEAIDDLSTPATDDVLFKFTNTISEPQASIVNIYFDTGNYTDLFTDMSIYEQSTGVSLGSLPLATNHPFLPNNFTEDYKFGIGNALAPAGINPGEYTVLSATLGTGMTYADVIIALDEGLINDTETAGLRIAVLGRRLYGTGGDDAAYVTNSTVVPLPAAWPMMMAGLGLMGLIARRRTASADSGS